MISFGSDNHSGIHPSVIQAIERANTGHAIAYGDDPLTARVQDMLRGVFGPQAESWFVFNGTGANVLALKTVTRSYHAVICPANAHIWTDECGAPEKQLGCKLIPVETPDGKLTPQMVAPHLHAFGFAHHSQPRVISISQPTEFGTLYTIEEIRALADTAHANGMLLHIDGARFANAVAAMGCSPREMTTDAGVDILSLGGTKNGLMMAEAVVFLNPELCRDVQYERKQLMQLSSKMRFVAAQFEAYLTDGLWLRMAAHSNAMAELLERQATSLPGVTLAYPRQVNGVFAAIPPQAIERLMEEYFFYVWDEQRNVVRWLTSFDTTPDHVAGFVDALRRAVSQP